MLPDALPAALSRPLDRVFEEQVREISRRCLWDMVTLAVVIIAVQVFLRPVGSGSTLPILGQPFVLGALTWPYAVVLVLFAALWALRVWNNLPVGDRDHFLARPVDHRRLILTRVLAGLAVFLAVFVVAWALGAIITDAVVAGGRLRYRALLSQGWGWLWTLLGMVNAYLYATIFALRFRNPEQWILVWVPLGILLLGSLALVLPSETVVPAILWVIDGFLRGLGFAGPSTMVHPTSPMGGWIMIWLVILTLAVVRAARLPQKDPA